MCNLAVELCPNYSTCHYLCATAAALAEIMRVVGGSTGASLAYRQVGCQCVGEWLLSATHRATANTERDGIFSDFALSEFRRSAMYACTSPLVDSTKRAKNPTALSAISHGL